MTISDFQTFLLNLQPAPGAIFKAIDSVSIDVMCQKIKHGLTSFSPLMLIIHYTKGRLQKKRM